ncbi:MAG: hypothetical protein SCARUB_03948 [Candidatus Scalindua rubra]|uniref:Uncharacterized protein n=1 Tax=Candidatus Scalindua rubra TaxID=1872076 RepID=A0A1E3X5T5_9BACT|nr:MAG: hypothetical protein SCARUB_03948 [Candidatus Scalindua rubra]
MKEDVNVKIIKKLRNNKCHKNLKQFIIDMIREEFAHKDQSRWNYSEIYDRKIKMYSKEFEK